ncbi:Hypothetical predicted protein [Xyrichtys novacula]|uniref:Uncharacterized protein n=1 Tax=Xyrichtys novacula TaxID=13765 RepID=A0AAV1GW11_XYRNO|nr:Hypothetical predicted protein [Xyrichtys novacula]
MANGREENQHGPVRSPDGLQVRLLSSQVLVLHGGSVRPCTSGKHVHNFLHRTHETATELQLRTALLFSQICTLPCTVTPLRGRARVHPRCAERCETAQRRRKLCAPRRSASPQNSSTHILLSNPSV